MTVILLGSNPFFQAYAKSDAFGKIIFLALAILSIASWIVLVYKIRALHYIRKLSLNFQTLFEKNQSSPLAITNPSATKSKIPEFANAFFNIYDVLKKRTLEILNKNKLSVPETKEKNTHTYLSASDIDILESHLMSSISSQTNGLEKNLFILSTTVSLAPFLGLLGTVWGILMTFSELQSRGFSQTNEMVLGGLSMALATTVLGLLIAIPALIAYNYLKSSIRDFEKSMEHFSTVMLAAIELQYRKVDVK